MIEKLITIILIELIIVLGMLIISWIFNYFFYEEPAQYIPPREQSHDFTIVLSKEQAEEFKKLFEDNDD